MWNPAWSICAHSFPVSINHRIIDYSLAQLVGSLTRGTCRTSAPSRYDAFELTECFHFKEVRRRCCERHDDVSVIIV